MGKLKNGIFGGFSGSIGALVGYLLRGKWIVRQKPHKRKGKATKLELANRMKFGEMQHWLAPITKFLRVGFANYAADYEGFVAAKSYNLKNAVTGVYPDIVIDPALALVSFGKLSQAWETNVVVEEPNQFTVTWSGGSFDDDDRAMILAYDTQNQDAFMDTAGPWRRRGKYTVDLDYGSSGTTMHIYLAFISENRKQRSNSQYLGEITIH
jgi:hypothetical protein